MIVVDVNIVAYLFLPGERTSAAEQVLFRDKDWCVPLLWRSELRNILTNYLRADFIQMDIAAQICEKAERMLKDNEYAVVSSDVLEVSAESALSAYDAEYVSLAKALGVKLVTSDQKILKQCRKIAISPERFIAAGSA